MRLVQPAPLESLAINILQGAGTPPDIASYVATSLVDSNLKGVDSHGVMVISWYVDEMSQGRIKPAHRPRTIKDTPAMAVVRGNAGFGIFALGQATELAIQKAKASQVAGVGLVDASHTGRIGQFVEAAAHQGVVAMIIGGGAHRVWPTVAPHGGARPILGTNPYAFGLPGGKYGPIVVDFATSAVAYLKLDLHRAKKEPVPPGWILDKHGRPSTNAEDFFDGGVQLPAAGHKGYGLGLVAELIGDALMGVALEFNWLNWLVMAIDIAAFRPLDDYLRSCETYLHKVKEVPPAPRFDEVLLPGEPESRTAERRKEKGIPIPDQTWKRIREAAQSVGVDPGSFPNS